MSGIKKNEALPLAGLAPNAAADSKTTLIFAPAPATGQERFVSIKFQINS